MAAAAKLRRYRMKAIMLLSLVALTVTAAALDRDDIRSRLEAGFGWDHDKGFAFDLHVAVEMGA
jgi:hypothetical protein